MLRKLLALALFILVAACSSPSTAPVQPLALDYTKLGKINLAVNRLDFTKSAPVFSGKDASFFQNYQPTLNDALYRWGTDRLQAGGSQGRASLIIRMAEFNREALPRQNNVESWFTRTQSERWRGKVAAELRIESAAGNFSGTAAANAERSTTLPEDASASEREAAYRRLLRGLMDDVNSQMEHAIRTHLNPVVLTMP